MDLSQITRIVELMSKHDLTEIDIKSDELALTIKRERKESPRETQIITTMPQVAPMIPTGMPQAPAPSSVPTPSEAPKAPANENEGLAPIESPLVGTFYASPSPDAEPFVKIGDHVTKETVVCIVEAMKVMNEIKAEAAGTIRKAGVENAQPVEFGQPLFWIQPD